MNEKKIITIPEVDYTPDARGLGFVYYENMIKNSKKIAQIDAVTGAKDSFESLLRRSIRTAVKMRAMNVTSHDIVATCSLNHLNSCVPSIATAFLGATAVSLDPNMSPADLQHLMGLIKPKLLFAAKDTAQILGKIIDKLSLDTQIVAFDAFFSFIIDVSKVEENNFRPTKIDDLGKDAMIQFSSGSTGLSKGIRLSHRSVLGQTAVTIAQDNCYDRILTFSSLYWGSAVIYYNVSLLTGCTRIIVPKFDINTIWIIIDTYKPTLVFTPPYYAMCMYKSGIPSNVNVDSIKTIVVGGGPLSKNQITGFKKMFSKQRVFLSYGSSETGFSLYFKHGNRKDDTFIDQKPTSCGSGIFGFSYKVVDPETEKVLEPNEIGELRLKSKYMLTGYFKMDSTGIWDSDGFVKTGDIVYYDNDHFFYIVNRLKELLKYQAITIFPSVIEDVLLTHPSVKMATVIGIPDEIDGDHPMALVILNDRCDATESELIKFANDRLGNSEKLRAGLKIVQSVPVTSTGKINKLKIKELMIKNGTNLYLQ
ncbi:hypothetical protein RN001_015236 [Aquatica leii]|uniref:Luciferin 4-monooxygenase n=1 Tax=Aquatica leii TaxID=1421715 RepID=A0AAN7NYT4_9COLE|nr:hypothetical protein RN001_015236 [Aquatica leii]